MKIDLYENEVTPDGVDDGGTGDRPDWLPENFKDPETFRKSYDEQRKEMDRLRTQADEDRAQFAAALERIEQAPPPQQHQPSGIDPQTNQLLTQYNAAYESGDSAAMLAIQLGLNQQMMAAELDARFAKLTPTLDTQAQADRNIAFELAKERVGKLYGDDWEDLQPEVQTWLNEHQTSLPVVNDPVAFEKVIREGAQTIVNARAAERLAAFEADRQAKLGAQTAAGSGSGRHSTVGDSKAEQWQEIAGADVGSYGQIAGKQ